MNGVRGSRGRKQSRINRVISKLDKFARSAVGDAFRPVSTVTTVVCSSGKYFESFETQVDRSITQREHLRLVGQTLLNRQRKDADPYIVRETSKSKKIVPDHREKDDIQLGVELDI